MKLDEKHKARLLRAQGESIKVIAQKLGVSKGSVSFWVRDIVLTDQQNRMLQEREHSTLVVEKRRRSRLSNEQAKRDLFVKSVKKDISKISSEDLKRIGTVLYWAEGRKRGGHMVTFSNSDPVLIKIMMRFFREICSVENKKFRAHIHTYAHINVTQAEMYWSKITMIPLKQFYKTYAKPSKAGQNKMDSLPYGTVDIYVCDTKLFLKIKGWMEKIAELLLV